jgi:hypothetical protein
MPRSRGREERGKWCGWRRRRRRRRHLERCILSNERCDNNSEDVVCL